MTLRTTRQARLRRCTMWVVGALVVLVGVTNGEGAPPPTALPFGLHDPHAITERSLAQQPDAALGVRHVAFLFLEPAGSHEGDTGSEEGVDEVPYVFDRRLRIRLQLHASAEHVGRLVLKDRHGREVACLDRGIERAAGPAPMNGADTETERASRKRSGVGCAGRSVHHPGTITVHVHPGPHVLEVHHARKGQTDAPAQRIFLRPRIGATAAGATAEQPPPTAGAVVTLEASGNCEDCDFSNADLSGHDFSGLTLSGSIFTGADLSQANFTSATMSGCDLRSPSPLQSRNDPNVTLLNETVFIGANLTGSQFDGAWGGGAKFDGAILDGTTWGPRRTGTSGFAYDGAYPAIIFATSFRNASLKIVTFNGALLDGNSFASATIEASFQTSGIASTLPSGDLQEVTNVSGGHLQTSCQHCVFAGATINGSTFNGVNLANVSFDLAAITSTTFNDADLTNAGMLEAHLNGVDLFGTKLTGVDLNVIAPGSVIRSDFSGDVTGANLSDVNFTGFDLSRANLSGAILSPQSLASLAGATLSDGVTHGITLGAGTVFPDSFGGFLDKDLSFANLGGVTLKGANLANTKLVHANLTGATLTGALLTGANLANATLIDTQLAEAALQSATLVAATLQGAILNFANLDGTNLQGAHLNKSPNTLVAANLDGAFLRNANLASANLTGASLAHANFYSSLCAGCTCLPDSWSSTSSPTCATAVGATMTGTVFTGAYLSGLDLSGSTPQAAQFDGAVLVAANFTGATLSEDENGNPTLFTGAFLQGATFTNATVTGADFTNAYVDLTSAQGANVTFLLDPTHTAFTDYWQTPQTLACVQATYSAVTALPTTGPSNVCPDGVTGGPCSQAIWQSPHVAIGSAQPPSSVCPPGLGCRCILPNGTLVVVDLKWLGLE